MLFVQKGFSIANLASSTFNYIDIPLLYKQKISSSLYGLGGIHLGYVVSGTTNVMGAKEKIDFTGTSGRFEAGLNLGAGLEFGKEKNRTFLEVRYQVGLTSLAGTNSADSNIKNKGFAATFGLFL